MNRQEEDRIIFIAASGEVFEFSRVFGSRAFTRDF